MLHYYTFIREFREIVDNFCTFGLCLKTNILDAHVLQFERRCGSCGTQSVSLQAVNLKTPFGRSPSECCLLLLLRPRRELCKHIKIFHTSCLSKFAVYAVAYHV